MPPFVTQPSEAVAVRSSWYQPGVLIESGNWPLSEAAKAEPLATSVPAASRTVQPIGGRVGGDRQCESSFANHTLDSGEPTVNGSKPESGPGTIAHSLTTMREWPTS